MRDLDRYGIAPDDPPRGVLVTPEIASRAQGVTFDACDPVAVKGIDEPIENLVLRA